ncbi:MAG: alanine--tRNA ligase-related protein [Patescibacteria group bacterium]
MKVSEVREKYLEFMKSKGHTIVSGASLVPENDPTTLFTSSGMQPLVPYLLGREHPAGVRIANSQRSFRAQDIEEVGDNRHTTYFEMLGNWSFGDADATAGAGYFKKEQLSWFYEFVTEIIEIDKERLSVTCFEGDEKFGLPRDNESFEIWKSLGVPEERIFFYGGKKNWWSRGGPPENTPVGDPAGPDSEVFYDFGIEPGLHEQSEWKNETCHPNCGCGRFMEIGNSVFMEYKRESSDNFVKLPRRNVDFGGGLERITAGSIKNPDIFMIDIFEPFRKLLEQTSGKKYGEGLYTRSFRIVMDHVRAAHALIEDGVRPSNTEQGYVLRRLIRRAIVHADKLGIPQGQLFENEVANEEEMRFRETLKRGMREIERGETDVFKLATSYGLPVEVLKEIMDVDDKRLHEQIEEHREKSRAGSEGKFKGGLADTSDMSVKYHTATHLLQQALRTVLGKHVVQKGSNITPERLRFDFSHTQKMTDEEKKQVEELVNEQIRLALPVTYQDLPLDEAQKMGAIGLFEEKYNDKVRVFKIGDFSLEFCGGPHVGNTRELANNPDASKVGVKMRFRILKEEAVSSGIRRIKAVLE